MKLGTCMVYAWFSLSNISCFFDNRENFLKNAKCRKEVLELKLYWKFSTLTLLFYFIVLLFVICFLFCFFCFFEFYLPLLLINALLKVKPWLFYGKSNSKTYIIDKTYHVYQFIKSLLNITTLFT